jgi:hypothetical protein
MIEEYRVQVFVLPGEPRIVRLVGRALVGTHFLNQLRTAIRKHIAIDPALKHARLRVSR